MSFIFVALFVVACCFVAWLLNGICDSFSNLREIASTLKEILDLLKVNATKQADEPEEQVSIDELCRRFRIKLEQAQHGKRQRYTEPRPVDQDVS